MIAVLSPSDEAFDGWIAATSMTTDVVIKVTPESRLTGLHIDTLIKLPDWELRFHNMPPDAPLMMWIAAMGVPGAWTGPTNEEPVEPVMMMPQPIAEPDAPDSFIGYRSPPERPSGQNVLDTGMPRAGAARPEREAAILARFSNDLEADIRGYLLAHQTLQIDLDRVPMIILRVIYTMVRQCEEHRLGPDPDMGMVTGMVSYIDRQSRRITQLYEADLPGRPSDLALAERMSVEWQTIITASINARPDRGPPVSPPLRPGIPRLPPTPAPDIAPDDRILDAFRLLREEPNRVTRVRSRPRRPGDY